MLNLQISSCLFILEYQNANEEHQQINGDNESSEHDAIRQCDIIRVTGKQENCDRAIQALLDLVPITIEVDVPYDFHKSIIGQKGRYVRELMQKYDVHISVSPQEQKLNAIKVKNYILLIFYTVLFYVYHFVLDYWNSSKSRRS